MAYVCSRVFEILEPEWNPNITDVVFEGPITAKRTLNGKETVDDFYFSCNVEWSNPDAAKKREQFEVVFTFDGHEENSVPPKFTNGSNLKVKLWSTDMEGHFGKAVSRH